MKRASPAGTRPKLLAVSAGPTRRLNHQTVLSPRSRPGSQRIAPLPRSKASGPLGPARPPKKGFYASKVVPPLTAQAANGKLSVDQVLKQLGCANEKVLNDVAASITRSNGTNSSAFIQRAPLVRSRSGPPMGMDRKMQGDMLLESFNSVAFRQQTQKGRQQSAAKAEKGGRAAQLAPLKTKVDKPKSPRYLHNTRVSAVGPCKCNACTAKRHQPGAPPGKPSRDCSSAKKSLSAPLLSKAKAPPQLSAGSHGPVRPSPLVKTPAPEKVSASSLTKATGTPKPESTPSKLGDQKRLNQASAVTAVNETTGEASAKKPFAFLQTLFKSADSESIKEGTTEKNLASRPSDKAEAGDHGDKTKAAGVGDKNQMAISADKNRTAGPRDKNTASRNGDKDSTAGRADKTSAANIGGKKPAISSADKKPMLRPADKEPIVTSTGKSQLINSNQKNLSPDSGQPAEEVKPASATYDRQRLSTISEEHGDGRPSTATTRRHSADSSGSVTLDGHADDADSVVSYPFPRPRTGSTCCQSFQFMEVMTSWVPNGEGAGAGGKRVMDLEPFGVFEAIDGVVGGGNFINLKDDLVKSRKIIKSRIGIRSENEPEMVIQWKRGPILGRGAFGTVWCGLTMAGEMVAVKQAEISSIDMQKARKEYEKVQQEVDLLKSLSHKNVVGYLGTSLEDRIVSIFMQFIPGGSLTSVLRKFGALAESVVACYTKQILEGVEYLHSKNVVHRDIKGSNVMLMPNAVIKLIDFGCAKRAIKLTKSNEEILKSMKGTPYWMAPEVMNETGHGKKSDIWSIGCTVFEMATSRPPWSHLNRYAALFTIANGTAPTPQLPDKFSVDAKCFVADCMIRDPDKRPDATALLNRSFILQHCQHNGKRVLDSRGVPLNSTKRQ